MGKDIPPTEKPDGSQEQAQAMKDYFLDDKPEPKHEDVEKAIGGKAAEILKQNRESKKP